MLKILTCIDAYYLVNDEQFFIIILKLKIPSYMDLFFIYPHVV